ncbi:MAG: hypothetical protein JXA33_27565 [Anaerolineae bacterium]|nr:hypothetical protein [Anaerolineae bacterium]
MPIFRTFNHLGKTFELVSLETTAENPPQKQMWPQAPGAGEIEIDPITLSVSEAIPGTVVSLSTRVCGRNIAFIYADVLLYDDELGQAYGPVYRDYVRAANNKEVRGVIYPVWEEVVHVALEYIPTLRILSDGVNSGFGFVSPEQYGSLSAIGTYWINGLYTTSEGQTPRDAKMYFNSAGKMEKLVVAGTKFGRKAMREVKPKTGEQFTPLVQLLSPSQDKATGWQEAKCLTNTLTFYDRAITWTEDPPIPGTYLVGVIIQDLDGRLVREYTKLTLQAAD